MSYIYKAALITILLFNVNFSQTKNDTTFVREEVFVKGIINESLSSYQIKVVNDDEYIGPKYRRGYASIIILDTLKSDTLSISEFNWKTFNPDINEYELEDINFDGYNDLLVLRGYSADGMVNEYDIYIFNYQDKRFDYSDKITGTLGWNTMIDKDSKEITVGGASGMDWTYEWRTYKFLDGSLIQIREESQERLNSIDTISGERLYKWIKQVRKDGSLVVEKEIIGTAEELEVKTN